MKMLKWEVVDIEVPFEGYSSYKGLYYYGFGV